MTVDHIGLAVSDHEKSKPFFSRVLVPLNIEVVMETQGWAGLGKSEKTEFCLGQQQSSPLNSMHIAFTAESRAQVRAFHEATLLVGA